MGGNTPKASAVKKKQVAGSGTYGRVRPVSDVSERIGGPGIFRNGLIGEIDDPGTGYKPGIFQHRSRLDCLVNLRFLLSTQVDHFGVTPSLEIENLIAPAVLVVTDELPFGVG